MLDGIKRRIQPLLKRLYFFYLRKKRWYTYDGLKICIFPSVFYPGFLYSTKFLLRHIQQYDLNQKSILELGAGSGLIALWVCRSGANVTATDINPKAIESIEESMVLNHLQLITIVSDLFDNIPNQTFDFIIINPPFYPVDPKNHAEQAFFGGSDFEYFRKLFHQLHMYMVTHSLVFMVLSTGCDLDKIRLLAEAEGAQVVPVAKQVKWFESLIIYQIIFE